MALPLSYSVRNVTARPARSLLTAGVIALVVVACTLFMGLISSLQRTLVTTGNPLNLVMMRKGADNDGSSSVDVEAYQAVRFMDGVARNADDEPLASPELVMQPFMHTHEGGRENVLVRGVTEIAREVHEQVTIVEGRFLRPSAGEVIVGAGVRGRYIGAELGSEIEFGRGRWKVVGVFEAAGTSFESEVWADVRELARDSMRIPPYAAVRLRTTGTGARDALIRRIEEDTRWALTATPEPEYYAKQSESANVLYALVIGVAVLAGIGAGFGAANTMYAAVQARTAEIGTLRAMGFSRRSILWAFELEAAALAFLGFALGAILSVATAAAIRSSMNGIGFGADTFTTNVVSLEVAPGDLIVALVLALVIGLGGGLAPAWRAARLRPVEALRRA